MDNEDYESWGENSPNEQFEQIQKLINELNRRSKKCMDYLVAEGFIEPTATPGVYNYTPEGLVLAKREFKKLSS
jgi:hypothetical protein